MSTAKNASLKDQLIKLMVAFRSPPRKPVGKVADSNLKIFISYSRRDMAAADVLVGDLESEGFEVTIDRRDLPYGEEWQKELADFIRTSDTVVWLISPDSVGSKWVNWELGEVTRLHKRLVPVRIREFDPTTLPEALGKIHLLPAEEVFEAERHLKVLIDTIKTNYAWLKEATRLADRARQWIAKNRDSALHLRGAALHDAEIWTNRQPQSAPPPSGEILELILASRRGASRRQRWAIVAAVAIAIASSLGGLYAWQQQQEARLQSRLAEQRAIEARKERDHALVTQSRFLGVQASEYIRSGQAAIGALVLLEGLPDVSRRDAPGRDRPHVQAIETALLESIDKITESYRWTLRQKYPDDADISRDGQRLVGATPEGSLQVWNTRTGELISTLARKNGQPKRIAFSPDSLKIAGVSDSGVDIWDADTGQQVTKIHADMSWAWSTPVFSPDSRFLAVAAHDEVRILDSSNGREAALMKSPGNIVSQLQFSASGQRLLRSNFAGGSEVWSVSEGKLLAVHNGGPLFRVGRPVISPDGSKVIAPHVVSILPERQKLMVRDADTSELITEFPDHEGSYTKLAFSSDGTRLLTGMDDGRLVIVDAMNGKEVVRMSGHTAGIIDAEFVDDDKAVLSWSGDGTIRLWRTDDGQQTAMYSGHYGRILKGGFASSPTFVISLGDDGTARRWGGRRSGGSGTFPNHLVFANHAAFSPDSKLVATNSVNDIDITDIAEMKPLYRLEGHSDEIQGLVFNSDGKQLLSGSADKTVRIWDIPARKEIRILATLPEGITALAADVYWKTLIVRAGGLAYRIHAESGNVSPLAEHEGRIEAVGVSGNGQLYFTLSQDRIVVHRSSDDSVVATVKNANCSKFRMASLDGNGDHLTYVCSPASGMIVELATGNSRELVDNAELVAFSRDGSRLFSVDDKRNVEIWVGAGREKIGTLRGQKSSIEGFALSPDGRWLALTELFAPPVLLRTPISAQDLVDYAKGVVPMCLSRVERERAFLAAEPPDWCITGAGHERETDASKWQSIWPYQGAGWRKWLIETRSGKLQTMPDDAFVTGAKIADKNKETPAISPK